MSWAASSGYKDVLLDKLVSFGILFSPSTKYSFIF